MTDTYDTTAVVEDEIQVPAYLEAQNGQHDNDPDEVDGHLDITMPSKGDSTALEQLLQLQSNVRGVITLKKRIGRYMLHERLAEDAWSDIETSVAFLRGERTPAQLSGLQNRTRKSVAQKYFESLSDTALQKHCQAYGVTCDEMASRDDIIQQLLAAQAA